MTTAPRTCTQEISARDLHVSYGDTEVISGLDVTFPAGKVTTIIGPNGCGKSTLLKATSRLIPSSGQVRLDDCDVTTLKKKELAKLIGVLPQSPIAPEGLLVADLVARGRHPHQSWINQWSSHDEEEVVRALENTGSAHLADHRVDALSGGLRQRVWISMVLAQNTDVLFLDEPTTYLDLSTSIEVLNLVTRLRDELERTVVMVLHDLNLAVRYSDHLVVMRDGAVIDSGAPADVITSELLAEVFDLDALIIEDPATGGPLIVPAAPATASAAESQCGA